MTTTTNTSNAPIAGNVPYLILTGDPLQIAILDIDTLVPGGQEQVITIPPDPINQLDWLLIPVPNTSDQYKIQTTISTGNIFLVVIGSQVSTTTALAAASTWNIVGQENTSLEIIFNNELLTTPDNMGNPVTIAARRATGNTQKWKFVKNMSSRP